MQADLEAVIEFLGGPVHLVAHDWGALIAWAFVADNRSKRLVLSLTALSCPHPTAARQAFVRKLLGRDGWSGVGEALEQIRRSWYIFLFQLPFLPALFMRHLGGPIWRYMLGQGDVNPGEPLYNYTPEKRASIVREFAPYYRGLFRGPSLKPVVPIAVPCRQLIPLRDLAIVPTMYDAMPEYAPHLELVPQDANHWLHRDKPAETTRLIREFINKHGRSTSDRLISR